MERKPPVRLNKIAISDHGTLEGLTQFSRTAILVRVKPLNANEIDNRLRQPAACAII
jgi:hypothetical protein